MKQIYAETNPHATKICETEKLFKNNFFLYGGAETNCKPNEEKFNK